MSRLSATQQKKYLGKLRGAERAAREAEILYRREHRSDEPFVTDEGQPTKRSKHAAAFERKYGRAPKDTADAARLSGVPKKTLDEVYARGMAAWQTGHRPGASQHAWAMARVESFLTGGPTSKTADADLAREAKLKNPLLAKPQLSPSQHKLHRAGDRHTRELAKWAGLESADLYEGVHVSPSPAAAAAYALGRLKVDGDSYEVTDAPVLLGIRADCAKRDLGDVDVLTCAKNLVEAAKNNPDFDIENDDLQDLFVDYAATEYFDESLGLVQSLGDWANRPSVYDFADAVSQLQEFCKRKRSDAAVRDKAIELAKKIVPQVRWDGDVADDCIVAVVVLPPYKPLDDIARQNEPFPYDTSAEDEFRHEPIDRDYLDQFIRNGWKVLWGDPKKAKFWHGTSASLAAKALPGIVNQYAANELSFDSTAYRGEDEDLEENPDFLTKIDQLFDTTPASGIVKRPSDGASNRTQEWKRKMKEQRVFSFPAQVAWIRDNTDFPDPERWVRTHMVVQKLTDEELAEKTKQDEEFNSEYGLSPSSHFFRLDPSWSPAQGGPARWVPNKDNLPAGYTIERANPADQTHIPPGPVAAAARRGLDLRASQPASNRCCTSVGLRRAAQLANRQPVSEDTMRRMLSYFQRHIVDKKGAGWDKGTSKGLQAWLCWGGDEGYAWVRRVLGV